MKKFVVGILAMVLVPIGILTIAEEEKRMTQGRVKADNLQIGYKEKGSGDAIIFLHGVGSDKSVWDGQLEYFSRKWRAISLDYPGYGDSDLPEGSLTREDIGRYLFGAMDGLGIKSAHVVGLSMGGVMALEMVRQQPARPRSLTLADTFAKHPDSDRILERIQKAMASMSMREFAQARVSVLVAPNASDALKQEVVETMAKIDKRTYAWSSVAVWTADYRNDLPGIKIPTFIVVGEHDQVTPRALSEELHQGIPGSKLEIISGAGHIANRDTPDAFNRLVEEFISTR
jgi:3-oxoadipate enol-lactonase